MMIWGVGTLRHRDGYRHGRCVYRKCRDAVMDDGISIVSGTDNRFDFRNEAWVYGMYARLSPWTVCISIVSVVIWK
ncbi:hypothetical protein [Thalassotalea mangrovi]|uniref:Uncharacterized protein n=1 Tax=Thalassotalea mangrovi TaxID=2572245 RepID=A0A4U1B5Z3_9GAMM|nr:hypothetical protein [Thalassotalea mangrovi]TKB45883.1 hypothetical protein E8M12_06445 [Thalassotalea mangrovi]